MTNCLKGNCSTAELTAPHMRSGQAHESNRLKFYQNNFARSMASRPKFKNGIDKSIYFVLRWGQSEEELLKEVRSLQFESVNEVFTTTLNNTVASIAQFIPRFITGLIVLLIGLIIASLVKQALLQVFKIARIEQLLEKYGVPDTQTKQGVTWTGFLAELARWLVIVVFFVPTADIWGLGQFSVVLNNLLSYLPNVLVSVLILLVGFVVSGLVYDLILASVHGISKESAKTVAIVGRYSVLVFTILIVLNQLGIASDLIRILFAGIVAMVAIAGGLAFGLGGREVAQQLLTKIIKRL